MSRHRHADLRPIDPDNVAFQQVDVADELRGEAASGRVIDLLRPAGLLDLPAVEQDDAIGHFERFILVVRDEQRGDADALLQVAQFLAHALAKLGVEIRERLVEQEDAGFDDQCAGEGNALSLAAAELIAQPVTHPRQPDQFQHCVDPGADLVPWHFAHAQAEGHVLEHGPVREQSVALENDAHAPVPRLQIGYILSGDHDAAGGWLQQARDDVQRRCLAAAAGAEKADELAIVHCEADRPDRGGIAIALDDAIQEQHGIGQVVPSFRSRGLPSAIAPGHGLGS